MTRNSEFGKLPNAASGWAWPCLRLPAALLEDLTVLNLATRSAVLVDPALRLRISVARALDAFTEECQQLVSGSETQFSCRINLFYPAFVVLPGRLRVRPQPENERRSHHRGTIRLF